MGKIEYFNSKRDGSIWRKWACAEGRWQIMTQPDEKECWLHCESQAVYYCELCCFLWFQAWLRGLRKTASPLLTLDFAGGKRHWKPGYLLLQLPLCSPLGRPEVSPVHRLPMRLLEMPFYVMLRSQFLKNTKIICGKLPQSWIKRNLNQEVETRHTSLLPIWGVRKCS